MKTIYFVRHGQTASNVNQVTSHPSDPLTDLGKRQAEAVRPRLVDLGIEVILTSPYTRTQQTAEIINEVLRKEIIPEPTLEEQKNIASTKGIHFQKSEMQDIYKSLQDHVTDPQWHYENEENFFDIHARAKKLLAVLRDRPEQTILAVTHGNILRAALRVMLLGDLVTPEIYLKTYNSLALGNTGVTVCQFTDQNEWKLIRWNDTVHLTPELYTIHAPQAPLD